MRPILRSTLAFLVLGFIAPTARAYTEPILQSYTRESPDKAFVFVMLHPARPGESDPIREKYSKSGLYRNDGSITPLWTFDDGYVRDAYPASDGIHVVVQYLRVISLDQRTCGNSPEPPANPKVLGFYAKGKKIRDVKLGELLDHVAFCREHGPGWHDWLASARIKDDDGSLVVLTTQGTRRALDLNTGDLIDPILQIDEIIDPTREEEERSLRVDQSVESYVGLVIGVVLLMAAIAGTIAIAFVLFRSQASTPE